MKIQRRISGPSTPGLYLLLTKPFTHICAQMIDHSTNWFGTVRMQCTLVHNVGVIFNKNMQMLTPLPYKQTKIKNNYLTI